MQSPTTASSSQQDSQLTTNSQHTDSTYSPDSDSDMDVDLTTTSPVEDIIKYLVFESELHKLIKYCPDCGSIITNISKTVTGSALSISYSCIFGHNKTWHSQPVIRHIPAGNLLLSAAVLLSGSTFGKTEKFATIMRMPIPSKSEFYNIQKAYLIPVINDYWTIHQTAIFKT